MVNKSLESRTLSSNMTNTLSNMQKGSIVIDSKKATKSVFFHYNPTEYTVKKSVTWDGKPAAKGENAQRATFQGVESTTLTLNNLLFDSYQEDDTGVDVRRYTNELFKLVQVDPDLDPPRPPFCRFNWGSESGSIKNTEFKAYVNEVSVQYILFLPDGTPCRAKASLTLTQVPDSNPGQNPTTEGTYGNKYHVVQPGDTLAYIAYQHYGQSGLWRLIADSNGISDPLKISVGDYLEIVPSE